MQETLSGWDTTLVKDQACADNKHAFARFVMLERIYDRANLKVLD